MFIIYQITVTRYQIFREQQILAKNIYIRAGNIRIKNSIESKLLIVEKFYVNSNFLYSAYQGNDIAIFKVIINLKKKMLLNKITTNILMS